MTRLWGTTDRDDGSTTREFADPPRRVRRPDPSSSPIEHGVSADRACSTPPAPSAGGSPSSSGVDPGIDAPPSSRVPATPSTPVAVAPDLAARQAELVAALVAGGPAPAGFDPTRLAATRRALLRKRAGEAAKAWPLLAASLGPDWNRTFAAHHDGHEPRGALRDGWDVARVLRDRGELGAAARAELAGREADLRYDGAGEPRPRPLARARRAASALLGRR